jgi:two-component system nitrogen regulation sensor histidine kinase NtrY
VNAQTVLVADSRPRWRRRLSVAVKRSPLVPFVEISAVIALIAMLAASYYAFEEVGRPDAPLKPELVATLLVLLLVPALTLMVMVARRVALRRSARTNIGGRGRLHVRLVAIFSTIAAIPTLLVVIFASLLFQSGVSFWYSDQAKTVLASAENVSQIYTREHSDRIRLDVGVMGADMVDRINAYGVDSERFRDEFLYQTAARQLGETALLDIGPNGMVRSAVEWNPDRRPLARRFTEGELRDLTAGEVKTSSTPDRVEAVVRLDPEAGVFFYGARPISAAATQQLRQAQNAASAYKVALENARDLQLRFNAILLLVSLLIVALTIWTALKLADRLVRPVGELVDAARRVTAGDLSARVPTARINDEVSTLGNAFNRMTRRLEEQTTALLSANNQLESRRAFIEAVLSGVTAGVISVDRNRQIRLMNSSAEALLKTGQTQAVGQSLRQLAPELDEQLDSEAREDIIQFASGGEPRTLAVKRVRVEGGHVITFDDITDQLLDQRRAAWSDVARRIAHEIKNPLTPIQLAAERLQRRYAKEITSDVGTFERLTGTIVRQVGDLRRMVDEFSSFARMPKPVFREEAIAEVASQALFLHEVAHPDIHFSLDAPEPSPVLICDRRQLGQALTNIVKNGVEAIQQKREEGRAGGEDRIEVRIGETGGGLAVEIRDTGIGLPAERGRLTEPYMTTRVKGTGLGLAIVKKIVEEHFGTIEFDDAPGGGATVRLVFDLRNLARLGGGHASQPEQNVVNG